MGRISLYAALFLSIALAGCGSPVSTAKTSGPAFDPSNPGGDPLIGVHDSAGFFLKITSDTAHTLVTHRSSAGYNDLFHPTNNFSQECRVMNGATGGDRDIVCLAEIEELDLYFSELKVQYHVPRNMCRFLRLDPYHFWQWEPGTGPNLVEWRVRLDNEIEDITNSAKGKPVACAYNYTPQGGPNCCMGTFTQRVFYETTSGTDEEVMTTETWGGKPGNCLFGPAMDTQDKNGLELPKKDMFYIENTGLNQTYTIKPAIEMASGEVPVSQNIWSANFYNRNEHTQPAPPMPPPYNANRPIPTRYAQTYTGYLPSDTYDFSCLDAAEEVKYRIRLMIREWNENPISENGNPDTVGIDPGDNTAQINDRKDWFDVQTYPRDVDL